MKGDPRTEGGTAGRIYRGQPGHGAAGGSGVRVQQVHRAQGCCGAAADAAAGAVPAGAGGSGLQ